VLNEATKKFGSLNQCVTMAQTIEWMVKSRAGHDAGREPFPSIDRSRRMRRARDRQYTDALGSLRLSSARSIGFTGFVGESPFPVAAQNSLDVVGRVIHLIAFATVAQLQDQAIAVG
jgi:hypothetical protein